MAQTEHWKPSHLLVAEACFHLLPGLLGCLRLLVFQQGCWRRLLAWELAWVRLQVLLDELRAEGQGVHLPEAPGLQCTKGMQSQQSDAWRSGENFTRFDRCRWLASRPSSACSSFLVIRGIDPFQHNCQAHQSHVPESYEETSTKKRIGWWACSASMCAASAKASAANNTRKCFIGV